MLDIVKTFVRDDTGATAIEYGLIAALVSVAAVLALQGLGTLLANLFEFVEITLNLAVRSPLRVKGGAAAYGHCYDNCGSRQSACGGVRPDSRLPLIT